MLKDYYKILELRPEATLTDIKKNFRRLALRYHPDTNQGNRYAEAWYREVQEAYETLTDNTLRENYLQQRWLLKSQGKSFSETVPLTPEFILKQAEELVQQVKEIDHFRMDHGALQNQVLAVISDEHIDVLNSYNEEIINRKINWCIKESLFPLDFRLLLPIIKQAQKIHLALADDRQLLTHYFKKRKRQHIWDRYQALVILLATSLLCLAIYLAS